MSDTKRYGILAGQVTENYIQKHGFSFVEIDEMDNAIERLLTDETEALHAEIARLRECVRLSEIYITSLEDFIAGETSFFVSEIRSLVDEKQAYTRAREAVG